MIFGVVWVIARESKCDTKKDRLGRICIGCSRASHSVVSRSGFGASPWNLKTKSEGTLLLLVTVCERQVMFL